jgi:hypothetical protein
MREGSESISHPSPLTIVVHMLTFNCYGSHLRGDENGSDDRIRKGRGGPIDPSPALASYGWQIMTHAEARLSYDETFTVLKAFRETCAYRRWTLLAAHVRCTHVHLVVDGVAEPSFALRDFKAYASRALNRLGAQRHWARGGNVKQLQSSEVVRAAVHYVFEGQGDAMARYIASDY